MIRLTLRRLTPALAGVLLPLAATGAGAAESIKPAFSGAAESNHVFCDGTGTSPVHKAPCFVRSLYVTTGATAGYLMTFNAVAVPANGVLDGTAGHEKPIECVIAPANSTASIDFGDTSEPYVTGFTAAFSTTGCFTLTLSATAFFKGRNQ